MRRILVAPNSFKGCALSPEIAEIISGVLKFQLPENSFEVISIPLTDGGDGFLDVLVNLRSGNKVSIPFDSNTKSSRSCFSAALVENKLVIESALVIGLQDQTPTENNPLYTPSKPLGRAIMRSLEFFQNEHVEEILIGIGGTATVDMGIGMLSEFGLKLLDEDGNELEPIPINLNKTASVIPPENKLRQKLKFVIDCDNPLLGVNGGVRVYGPQKGLNTEGIEITEKGFKHLLELLCITNNDQLSGAGGGLASLVSHYYPTEIIDSRTFIINELLAGEDITSFDILITGEGKADEQTFMNKAPGVLLELFSDGEKKKFVLCGVNEIPDKKYKNISVIEISKYFDNFKDSIRNYKAGLEKGVAEITDIILNKK